MSRGHSELGPEHARSWLLIPATDEGTAGTDAYSAADIVVLDLEDGVVPSRKEEARESAAKWSQRKSKWVRINDANSLEWQRDLEMIREFPNFGGVILSKVETRADVSNTVCQIPPGLPIVALIESARGVEFSNSIAAEPGVVRLAFGKNDYRRDTGVGDSPIALAYPRSRLLAASKLAGRPAPIDGSTVSTEAAAVAESVAHSVEMGFGGKLCLESDQLTVINRGFTPTGGEVDNARSVIEKLGEYGEKIADGSDVPRLSRAKRIIERAELFGLDKRASVYR